MGMNTATAHRLLTALAHEVLLTFDPTPRPIIRLEAVQMPSPPQAVAPEIKVLRHQPTAELAILARRTEESPTYPTANRDSVCLDCRRHVSHQRHTLVAAARMLWHRSGAMALAGRFA